MCQGRLPRTRERGGAREGCHRKRQDIHTRSNKAMTSREVRESGAIGRIRISERSNPAETKQRLNMSQWVYCGATTAKQKSNNEQSRTIVSPRRGEDSSKMMFRRSSLSRDFEIYIYAYGRDPIRTRRARAWTKAVEKASAKPGKRRRLESNLIQICNFNAEY